MSQCPSLYDHETLLTIHCIEHTDNYTSVYWHWRRSLYDSIAINWFDTRWHTCKLKLTKKSNILSETCDFCSVFSPYAGGNGIERDVGNFASVPDVIESLDSRIGGVSFSISWMLRSDCLHNAYRVKTKPHKQYNPLTIIKPII